MNYYGNKQNCDCIFKLEKTTYEEPRNIFSNFCTQNNNFSVHKIEKKIFQISTNYYIIIYHKIRAKIFFKLYYVILSCLEKVSVNMWSYIYNVFKVALVRLFFNNRKKNKNNFKSVVV